MSKLVFVLISIVALLVLFILGSFIAKSLFNQSVEKEVEVFFSKVENKGKIVTKADIEGLPESVQKWLEYSGVVGKDNICSFKTKSRYEIGKR